MKDGRTGRQLYLGRVWDAQRRLRAGESFAAIAKDHGKAVLDEALFMMSEVCIQSSDMVVA